MGIESRPIYQLTRGDCGILSATTAAMMMMMLRLVERIERSGFRAARVYIYARAPARYLIRGYFRCKAVWVAFCNGDNCNKNCRIGAGSSQTATGHEIIMCNKP